MFNRQKLASLVAMAGPDFLWTAAIGSHRLSAATRVGLAIWLTREQDRMCAFCSDLLDVKAELAHIVSAGPQRKGFVSGNIAMACRPCNELDASNGPIIAFETILMPHLIQCEWPDMPFLASLGKQAREENNVLIAEKRMRRGM